MLAFIAFACYFQIIPGDLEGHTFGNSLVNPIKCNLEVEYALAANATEMGMAVEIAIKPQVVIVVDPLDQTLIGQLVKISVNGP